MSKIVENYVLQDVAGSGQYGKVFKAKNMKTDEVVAIKVIKLTKFSEIPKLEEFTLNEIKTLSKVENPNVVRFIEMLKTSNNMYLIYEFCNGGTLEQVLMEKKFLTEKEAHHIFRQLLTAFRTLYKANILHRDLKPSNILLHNGVLKVADFGFCKSLKGPAELAQTMVGSPIYMAPEILKGNSYSSKADIWSLGVVLFELLFGVCPFEEKSIQRLLTQIETRGLVIPKNKNPISQKTEDTLKAMLIADPHKRTDWPYLFSLYLPPEQPAPVPGPAPIQSAQPPQALTAAQPAPVQQPLQAPAPLSNVTNTANNNTYVTTANSGPSQPIFTGVTTPVQKYAVQTPNNGQQQTLQNQPQHGTSNGGFQTQQAPPYPQVSNNPIPQSQQAFQGQQIYNNTGTHYTSAHARQNSQLQNMMGGIQCKENMITPDVMTNKTNLNSSANNQQRKVAPFTKPESPAEASAKARRATPTNGNYMAIPSGYQGTQGLPGNSASFAVHNFRLLLKERNKLLFMAYTLNNSIDLSLTDNAAVVAFLLMKNLTLTSLNFRRSITNNTVTSQIKELENWEQFKQTTEFYRFLELIDKEHEEISRVMQDYRDELIKWIHSPQGEESPELTKQLLAEVNDSENIDQRFFRQQVLSYIEEVRNAARHHQLNTSAMTTFNDDGKGKKSIDMEKKLILHAIEISDALFLDECFDSYMDINTKYNDQKYFASLRNSSMDQLRSLLAQKSEYIKSKNW